MPAKVPFRTPFSCEAGVTVEGGLTIAASWDGRAIRGAEIRSARPLGVSRLLCGMAPQQAVDTVPLLFSLCGKAQGVAAVLAAEAALGAAPPQSALRVRRLLVETETAQEYLWRLLVDWPELLGEQAEWSLLAAARRRLGGALAEIVANGAWKTVGGAACAVAEPEGLGADLDASLRCHVLGIAPRAWAEIEDRAGLERWARQATTGAARVCRRLLDGDGAFGRSKVGFMPVADDAWMKLVAAELQDNPGFSSSPAWRGQPLETGALARTRQASLIRDLLAWSGNSVLTRFAARVVELVSLAGRLWPHARNGADGRNGAFRLAAGCGLGWVETARGLLLHRVEIAGGRVRRYDIVAPTEWNFHPRGALAQGVEGIPARDPGEVRRKISLLVQALDPCVACAVEVCHA